MFTISPEAKDYIRKKGGVITLYMESHYSPGGCCALRCISTRTPAVRMGQPYGYGDSRFWECSIDGITLVVSNDVVPSSHDGTIHIGLQKYLLAREITVRGARTSVKGI